MRFLIMLVPPVFNQAETYLPTVFKVAGRKRKKKSVANRFHGLYSQKVKNAFQVSYIVSQFKSKKKSIVLCI